MCDATDLDLVIALAPSPVADDFIPATRLDQAQESFPLDVFLCKACGLVQLLEVVDPTSIYDEFLYVTKSSPGLVDHFRGYAEEVVTRLALEPGCSVVEIGSNDGSLLEFFKRRGLRVLGVDPARGIAEAATRAGVETIPVCFTLDVANDIRRQRGAADLIVANNVIANI